MLDCKTVDHLKNNKYRWLLTGVAGFIGSNILEFLLHNNQEVIGIDNFETGSPNNLSKIKKAVKSDQWKNFKFIEEDIISSKNIMNYFNGVDFTLHQAALGSVPRSIKNPTRTNSVNIDGFLNVLEGSRVAGVKAFIFASSSSVYGDHKALPKKENLIGNPLSPYAVTKLTNEKYASVYSNIHGMHTIGLRYFNVFGKNQDPKGPYAAVIPLWVQSIIANEEVFINGDGSTSRDFCYVKNAVRANILAAINFNRCGNFDVFNIAVGKQTSLIDLFLMIKKILKKNGIDYNIDPILRDFREGDVKHSLANISRAKKILGYNPEFDLEKGMEEFLEEIISSKLKRHKA